jgi:hypothetical protein
VNFEHPYSTTPSSILGLKMLSRTVGSVIPRRLPFAVSGSRFFGVYEGQEVSSEQLVKKSDDWVIEETNFCLGRRTIYQRFKEEDDLARRTMQIMDSQMNKMHTRLRDGTVIPFTAMYLDNMIDYPIPLHVFVETPLLKYTWDETYEDAYDDPSNPSNDGLAEDAARKARIQAPPKQVAKH